MQRSITDYLSYLGIPFSVTNADRTWGKDGRPRKSKVRLGWPDLSAVIPCEIKYRDGNYLKYFYFGRAFFVEVKASKGGRLSPGQKAQIDHLEQTWASVLVARSVEEVRSFILDIPYLLPHLRDKILRFPL